MALTNGNPLVSVVIPCYNGARYLAETIRSVLSQTFRPIEVIVVDDASTDRSYAIAASFGTPVRVIRNPQNMERSWSRNRAIREAKSDLIAFVDADDIWLPKKLETQVPALIQSNSGFIYARAAVLGLATDASANERMMLIGGSLAGNRIDRLLVRGNVIPLLTVLMRRACWESVGGFDCRRWVQGCEDYDLWLRLSRHAPVGFQDAEVAHYRIHEEQTSANALHMSLTAARIRWRYMREYPDVNDGKDRQELWSDHFSELEWLAGQACLQKQWRNAVAIRREMLNHRPWSLTLWQKYLSTMKFAFSGDGSKT